MQKRSIHMPHKVRIKLLVFWLRRSSMAQKAILGQQGEHAALPSLAQQHLHAVTLKLPFQSPKPILPAPTSSSLFEPVLDSAYCYPWQGFRQAGRPTLQQDQFFSRHGGACAVATLAVVEVSISPSGTILPT